MVRVLAYEGGPQKYQPVANHWPDPTLQDLSNGGSLRCGMSGPA